MQVGQVYKLEKSWAYRYRAPDGTQTADRAAFARRARRAPR